MPLSGFITTTAPPFVSKIAFLKTPFCGRIFGLLVDPAGMKSPPIPGFEFGPSTKLPSPSRVHWPARCACPPPWREAQVNPELTQRISMTWRRCLARPLWVYLQHRSVCDGTGCCPAWSVAATDQLQAHRSAVGTMASQRSCFPSSSSPMVSAEPRTPQDRPLSC